MKWHLASLFVCALSAQLGVAGMSGSVSLTPDPLVDLSTEGVTDWAVWGFGEQGITSDLAAFSRKSDGMGGVVGAIPDPTDLNDLLIGDPLFDCGGCEGFSSQIGFSWTDGEAVATGDNLSGGLLFRRQGVGGGFSMSLPATDTMQRLTLYVSAFRSTGEFNAILSDASGSFSDSSVTDPPAGFTDALGVYTLDFGSMTPGTTLDISYEVLEDLGPFENVGLLAATLAPVVIDPPELVGDYNDDGVVDAGDYNVWRDSEDEVGADLPADGDGDGVVDPDDYDLWVANFGMSNAATAVPEPTTGALTLLVAIGCVARGRTR